MELAVFLCFCFISGCSAFLSAQNTKLPIYCDFEKNLCGFHQDDNDNFDWTRGSAGSTFSRARPGLDHTKSSRFGHYIYTDSSRMNQDAIASLESPEIPKSQNPYCVMFYVYMHGRGQGSLTLYKSLGNSTNSSATIWQLTGDQDSKWIPVVLSLPPSTYDFHLTIEASVGSGYQSDIALDDFSISNEECVLIVTNSLNCTFENGYCGWQHDSGWSRSSRINYFVGPQGDHTSGNGYYLYSKGAYYSHRNQTAVLQSPPFSLKSSDVKCLSFWYNVYGSTSQKLEVILETISPGHQSTSTVFTRSGDKNPLWHHGFVEIHGPSNNGTTVLKIVTSGGQYRYSEVTIDDTSITDGKCSVDVDGAWYLCTFESFGCFFNNATNKASDLEWVKHSTSGSGPRSDHSLGHSNRGHYMFASGKNNEGKRVRGQTTKIKGSSEPLCVSFWYFMDGREMGTLNVYTRINGTETKLYSVSGDQGRDWRQANFNVKSTSDFTLIFEAELAISRGTDIAFDDVKVTVGECAHAADCDFDTDFCGYTSSQYLKWRRTQGETPTSGTGPEFDHTKGNTTDLGYYAYLESTGKRFGDSSYLTSPIIEATGLKSTCFEFWYSMIGSDEGQLTLKYLVNGNTPGVVIWTARGEAGREWVQARIDVTSLSRFKLRFDGVIGKTDRSDIAVDDIHYYEQACASLP